MRATLLVTATDEILGTHTLYPPENPGGQDGRDLPGTGGSQRARVPERQPGREPEHPENRFPA